MLRGVQPFHDMLLYSRSGKNSGQVFAWYHSLLHETKAYQDPYMALLHITCILHITFHPGPILTKLGKDHSW